METNFGEGKKVLITGHTGFKGSWLSLWLQKRGANLVGFALPPPTEPSLFKTARVSEGMVSIDGDIRNLKSFQDVVHEYQPEIVFHMAAQSILRYSYDNPVETYNTNVMGTIHVLEAVRQSNSIRVLINVTSDKCYKNREWMWGYREEDILGGHDPYSSSKGCAELVTSAYRLSYFKPNCRIMVSSARAGNVIGGGDWAMDRLVPDIMNAIIDNKPPIIRCPNAIRPWQHVLEPLHGYMMLAEKLWHEGNPYAGAWNFGSNDDDAKPVSWIADYLTASWGNGAYWKQDKNYNPHEATCLKLDCSKAKTMLGWSPRFNISTALDLLVEWYSAYINKEDMREVTESEIQNYESIV